MRRSGQPSRPRAMTCCRFSSFKTLLTSMEGSPPSRQRPALFSLAGFQPSLIGRFWVSPEVHNCHEWMGGSRNLRPEAAIGARPLMARSARHLGQRIWLWPTTAISTFPPARRPSGPGSNCRRHFRASPQIISCVPGMHGDEFRQDVETMRRCFLRARQPASRRMWNGGDRHHPERILDHMRAFQEPSLYCL